jgi:acyl-CoA thioester hydrolase
MSISSGEVEFRVRYAETDQMGVVHHSRYAVYFEMGRTELLRGTGYSYRDMEESKAFLVVAKLEIKYHAPARYDDLLRLKTTVTRLTRARIEHSYELYRVDGHQLLTSGATTLACVDAEGRPTAIPDAFFEKTGLPMP